MFLELSVLFKTIYLQNSPICRLLAIFVIEI